jgi:hypothetical protein
MEILGTSTIRDDAEPYDVAQELWDTAETDAATRVTGRMQRYVMVAFRADDDEPESRHPFTMNGKARMDLLGGDTEGPTPSGHLAQLMRHDERMHQTVMQITETTHGRLMRDLESERARRIVLEDRQMEGFQMMQDLQDRKHERDAENRKAEQAAQRHDQMMAMLMSMAPLVISKMMGPAATAAVGSAAALPAAGARDESIHQFLKSLTEQDAMGIIGSLGKSPEKQMALMEIYKAHQEEEKRRDEPAPPSPEAGAPH